MTLITLNKTDKVIHVCIVPSLYIRVYSCTIFLQKLKNEICRLLLFYRCFIRKFSQFKISQCTVKLKRLDSKPAVKPFQLSGCDDCLTGYMSKRGSRAAHILPFKLLSEMRYFSKYWDGYSDVHDHD